MRSPHGTGKAMPYSLEIDTPSGRRLFGDLEVGDSVFGGDGKPTLVAAVHEWGEQEVYRVLFDDGTETFCSAEHLWTVRQFSWEARRSGEDNWATLSIADLVKRGLTRSNGKNARARKWSIPTVEPLQYPFRWVFADPYTVGAWLGDGSRNTGHITNVDGEVGDRIRRAGYKVREINGKSTIYSVYGLSTQLRELGIKELGSREKYVPLIYKENISEIRKEILRGLLDTDGTITKEGTISFTSVSHQLAQDVAWLARSLGGKARVHRFKNGFGHFWDVYLTMPEDRWFYIERKQKRVRSTSQKRYLWRWIKNVESVGVQMVRCISVAADNGLYVANDCVVTHNSALSSWSLWWFALTRDALMLDWKCATTASAWRQLIKYLWPEVHKWGRRLNWVKIGRHEPMVKVELSALTLKLKYGQAFAVASDRPELIEGAHADHMYYLFDESKTIIDGTWDSAEGAMTGANAYWMAVSTPGIPQGRFYEIQSQREGLHDWWIRHVTAQEAIDAGRMDLEWAVQRKEQWGEQSAEYQNRVLGNFAQDEAESVIPLHWVELAIQRFNHRFERSDLIVEQIGLDVARRGGDETVLAKRCKNLIMPLEKYGKLDTMEAAGLVVPYLRQNPNLVVVVDVPGMGAGPYDRLAEQFPDSEYLIEYHPQRRVEMRDATELLEFANAHSAAWWGFREMLDPSNPRKLPELLALPPDKALPSELTCPTWKINSSGKIEVEAKEKFRDRLGRSPDSADATILACWGEAIMDAEYA